MKPMGPKSRITKYNAMLPIVVNFLGEPSTGKSTAAAYVFSKFKMAGVNCEYVSEYAKDKVYEECSKVFSHQEYIFGKQSYRMARVKDKVDVIITDSPLILSAIYNSDPVLGETFNKTVLNVFNSYNNINIFLRRTHEYKNEGRNEDEVAAALVRKKLVEKLNEYKIPYDEFPAKKSFYDIIVLDVLERIKSEEVIHHDN